jgi:hypothetical protein
MTNTGPAAPAATGPRSSITEHAPTREGNGSTRTWTRTLRGVPHSFTAVTMPNGERRYAVSRYNGYGDDGTEAGRRSGMRFGCAWSVVAFWTVRPPAPVAAAPEVGTDRHLAALAPLLALTPVQRNAVAGLAQDTDTPGMGLHAARRQVLESRGLITSQRVGTGRGAWTRADLTDLGRDVAALVLQDLADQVTADAANAEQDAQVRTANRRAVSAAEDRAPEVSAVVAEPAEDVPAWERNLARLADGPAADRIAELEAQLQRTESARSALADDLVAARNGAARQTAAYAEVRARVTELEDQRAPLRAAARDLAHLAMNVTSAPSTWAVATRVLQLTGDEGPTPRGERPDLVLVNDASELAQHPAGSDRSGPLLHALAGLGLAVRRGLPGERVQVRETHREHGQPLVTARVLGFLRDGVFTTDEGRDARVVPVELLAAYVADVRALGCPAPTARRAVLDALVEAQG